jgi:glycosyltransferase involved in cell wall biosynthesis
VKPRLGGIASYISELGAALARQPGIAVGIATSFTGGLELPRTIEVIPLSPTVRHYAPRAAWRERSFGQIVRAWKASVVIAPTPELPLRRLPAASIVVVHDVGPLQAPALYGRRRWARFALGLPLACRRADHVVCVSNATLLALVQCVGKLPSDCTVIKPADRPLPARIRRVVVPSYILNVGSMLRHKNVRTLVRAMNAPALRSVRLCLAGPLTDRERASLDAWRGEIVMPERIEHFGFVSRETLADLYAGAAAVALPSLYEGVGLPLLEAMRSGAPVVASAIPAHLEAGGDVPLYVERPLRPSDWATALATVVHDAAGNARMSRAGLDHMRGVTSDRIGHDMAHIARAVAARRCFAP